MVWFTDVYIYIRDKWILIYFNYIFSTEQPDSSVTCTTPKAKPTVKDFRFCAQNIPETQRSEKVQLSFLCLPLTLI